jgi:hypothetical protein
MPWRTAISSFLLDRSWSLHRYLLSIVRGPDAYTDPLSLSPFSFPLSPFRFSPLKNEAALPSLARYRNDKTDARTPLREIIFEGKDKERESRNPVMMTLRD